ncbi:TolC family protein [Flavobacteriales bacterium]|nr:TolC family protein [Flavobacteriales bacterium]
MKKLIIALALLSGYSSIGQESYSLKQAKEYAIQNSTQVKNSLLDVEIAQQKIKETTATGLPQISGTVAFQNFLDVPTSLIPASSFDPAAPVDLLIPVKFGTDFNLNGTLQVSQLIFSGNYLVALQASKTYKAISIQMVEKSELEIKAAVSEAYFTVVVLQANIRAMDSSLIMIKHIYDDTKILINEKVLEPSASLQLELSIMELENGLKQVNDQIIVAKKLLKFQMGIEIKTEISLADDLTTLSSGLEGEITSTINIAENIDYKMLQTQLKVNELLVKNKKADYLPTLAGFFSHQQVAMGNEFNFFGSDGSWYPTTIWGLNLSIPIFSGGQGPSRLKQAKIETLKTQNKIKQLDEGLQLQTAQATTAYNNSLESQKTRERAVEIANEVLRTTEVKFKEKVVSGMELTQAQSQVIQSKTNLINAKYEVLKAKLAIDKLVNKL